MHEAKEGQYDFSGDNDLAAFIQMANSAGLLVLVRAGDWTKKKELDHYTFLGNCPCTPPLSQHFAPSEK